MWSTAARGKRDEESDQQFNHHESCYKCRGERRHTRRSTLAEEVDERRASGVPQSPSSLHDGRTDVLLGSGDGRMDSECSILAVMMGLES